ncbi:MAG: PfkB family carbohydrate kinase, partial [Hydrogenoanaerobacterium sp.]
DTVGAGDGFAAGTISALMEGKALPEAVLRGNAIGAVQVMSRGDNDGLPNRKALAEFMGLKTL